MKDWSAIARAAGLDIPAKDLPRHTKPLDSLEETFRPLAQPLTPDMEPAFSFEAGQEQS